MQLVNPSGTRPKIFISSTIFDFKDLRSALKYWLEQIGYHVMLSEHNDFDKKLDENSYKACLDAIDSCQYFVLLVGSRVGGYFNEETKVSITQAEYRHAYERFKKGQIKIASFVRKEIWDIREDRKALQQFLKKEYSSKLDAKDIQGIAHHESRLISDASHIFEFIAEIIRSAEMKKAIATGKDYPQGNWLHQFLGFGEIILALEQEFKISLPLRKEALSANLKNEILNNLTLLLNKNPDKSIDIPTWALHARNTISGNIAGSSNLKGQHLGWLAMYVAVGIAPSRLSTVFLKNALTSGEFLDFNPRQGTFIAGDTQNALLKLQQEIEFLQTSETFFSIQERAEFIEKYLSYLKIQNQTFTIRNMDIVKPIVLFDHHYNAAALSIAIFKGLQRRKSINLKEIRLTSKSPFFETAQEIEAETMTADAIEKWIDGLP